MNKKLICLALSVGILTAGCSTTREDIAKDEAKAAKVAAEAERERREIAQEQMEETLELVPDWALKAPMPDGNGIYAVGMSEGMKMSTTLKKATLDAEFGLAKLYNQELSGSERMYTRDDNAAQTNEQYTALIDKLVSQVSVVGYEVIKQEIKPIDGKYHAFILIKMPFAQFNKVLINQRAKAQDQTIVQAFNDLERRLNERRKQRQEDEPQDGSLSLSLSDAE